MPSEHSEAGPERKEREFESSICLYLGESAIRSRLEREFPSLLWEESDSVWDKIRVLGTSPTGDIALIRVYRYESPGPFQLTVSLRVPNNSDAADAHLAIRGRILAALSGKLLGAL